MATKANGDPLEGTFTVPNYPSGIDNNVNMHPIGWASGDANTFVDLESPTVPTILDWDDDGSGTLDLLWAESGPDVQRYNVYIDGDYQLTVFQSDFAVGGNAFCAITGLPVGVQLIATVEAVAESGVTTMSQDFAVQLS